MPSLTSALYGVTSTARKIGAVGSLPGRARVDAALSAALSDKLVTLREVEKALRTPEIIEHMTQRVFRSVRRSASGFYGSGKLRKQIKLIEVKGVTRLIIERRNDKTGRLIASNIKLPGDEKTFYSRKVYPTAAHAKKQAVTRAAKWYGGDKKTQRQIKRLLIPRKRRVKK